MPRAQDDFGFDPDDDDDDNDVLSERDDPADADMDDPDGDDDDAETDPCPYCGKPVYTGAELCPHCRSFISFEDAPRRRPWWIWAGLILALAALLWVVF